jgi:hypothetical protein
MRLPAAEPEADVASWRKAANERLVRGTMYVSPATAIYLPAVKNYVISRKRADH